MASLGFVGLGAMGGRMARRLLAAGHQVVGFNRSRERAEALVGAGLRMAASARAVAEEVDVVFSMVTDTPALRAIGLGPAGLVDGLRKGATWVEMSTAGVDVKRELADLVAARGAALLDAPVSGSPITLESGKLSFIVGGDPAALERVRPYLLAIGPTVTHVGDVGQAVAMKIAINLGLAVQMVAFSEAVLLAEKTGIRRERAVEAVLRSVVASPMVQYRGPFVLGLPAEPLFNVPMMQKDLQLALDLGRGAGVPLPTTAVAQELLTAARALGVGEHDFAVVFDVLAAMSGLPPAARPPTPHASA
jgi:3-hydroxyisobutyrate dehydrogenase-like beta-hydroxyacid dehydrogenase